MLLEKINSVISFEKEILIEEKINFFNLEVICKSKPNINEEKLNEILSIIREYDSFSMIIQLEQNEPVTINSRNDSNRFIQDFIESTGHFEAGEKFSFKLKIDKSKAGKIRTIYSYKHFLIFWNEIEPIKLLDVLNEILQSFGIIQLQTVESNIASIFTKKIFLNRELQVLPSFNNNESLLKENCHFGNAEKYNITPDTFYLIDRTNIDLLEKLDILCSLFSIIFLFDITSINNELLKYKINGYRTINGEIKIDSELAKSKDAYYEIYDWCYSSEGNIADKLGLARNLISIHLTNNINELDGNALISIKSAYKTYLKENVSKYLEIRSQIVEELNWISQKSSDIVEKYLSNYQKSIFTFLSFFISVFILRVLGKGEFTDVFTKDATILSMAFLAISVIYLVFSNWNLKSEKERLKRKYKNVKERYKDLLVEKDIENILKEDKEFKYELEYVNKRHKRYLWLWITTIFILFISVLTVSSYWNWGKILEMIKTCG